MLRGPQTAGELRSRTARMFEFPDLAAVESLLQELGERDLVVQLARQPGEREARWAHLLCASSSREERVAALEESMAEVLRKLDSLLSQVQP